MKKKNFHRNHNNPFLTEEELSNVAPSASPESLNRKRTALAAGKSLEGGGGTASMKFSSGRFKPARCSGTYSADYRCESTSSLSGMPKSIKYIHLRPPAPPHPPWKFVWRKTETKTNSLYRGFQAQLIFNLRYYARTCVTRDTGKFRVELKKVVSGIFFFPVTIDFYRGLTFTDTRYLKLLF